MKPCCIFSYSDAEAAYKNFKKEPVKEFGKRVYNSDGSVKHYVYIWDKGGRSVIRCRNCGALFIFQWTCFYGSNGVDIEYKDYFQVESLQEAELLNETYDGLSLETARRFLRLIGKDDKWQWYKEI